MNKYELLEQAKKVYFNELDKVPLLSGLYIIEHTKLHDSGYRLMSVVGHTKDFDYYLIDEYCDVLDLESFWSKVPLEDLHLDINKKGIIHIWSGRNMFKASHAVSSCVFDVARGEDNGIMD